jgi:hypothetical protein
LVATASTAMTAAQMTRSMASEVRGCDVTNVSTRLE